uniref:Methionine aminopeptidase 2 n=1 Tax=Dermatophagoides pteronyssinus TaxID=6956 RepID=A0A6P6YJF7_DERPT|nr:proline--tRNA ligase, cytoplasmic-like [Dermatophagoides pteronyssinus]
MAGGKKEGKSCDAETSAVAKPALIGITCSRSDDLAKWYHEVLTKAELIEYYDVAGCYILRPNIFAVWEFIQQFIDAKFKEHGIKNCYFPMFVTKGKLTAEEDHLEGFSAEVAWVTKSGSSDLAEPIAIRPTSETIMYPAFSKWIRSHRDLPLKLNQWCPVVRWEFSHPTPFIRTREFLWQEGHTAHSTAEEADSFALKMLEVYRAVYEELLAIPVAKGRKSELEKFAGGEVTYTVEGFVNVNGRSIQAATSHYLGANFAKIFDVKYERVSGEFSHVHQTSFGLSTRSIGALILIHGDDKGLRLPSRVAPTQVVIVPIEKKNVDSLPILERCRSAEARLRAVGVRAEIDDRSLFSPGYKFNHWEMRGVPLRVEIGPRDVEQETVRLVRRVDGAKIDDAFANLEEQNPAHELYRQAAEAHRQTRRYIQPLIRPGLTTLELCEKLEQKSRQLTAASKTARGWAFPTGVSLNSCAAHFTPNKGDPLVRLTRDSVLKVDFGVHFNGYLIDSAFTVAFNEAFDPLLLASKEATNHALRVCGPDALLSDIGAQISEIICSYELHWADKVHALRPVQNLSGHSVAQYCIHASKSVPLVETHEPERMQAGEVFAIETFASSGKGRVVEQGDCSHYMLQGGARGANLGAIRLPSARKLYNTIQANFGTLAFCRRWLDALGEERYMLALKSLVNAGVVNEYPPLCDVAHSFVSQFEHTVIIHEKGKEVLSRGDDY